MRDIVFKTELFGQKRISDIEEEARNYDPLCFVRYFKDEKIMCFIYRSVVYLDQFYIYKDYRNKGYGLRIMKSIDRNLDYLLPIEYGAVFFTCAPIDYDETIDEHNEVQLGKFHNDGDLIDADFRKKRLQKFYKKAGFLKARRNGNVFYKRMSE